MWRQRTKTRAGLQVNRESECQTILLKFKNILIRKRISLSVCLSVCVCVRARARARVCVCVCVNLQTYVYYKKKKWTTICKQLKIYSLKQFHTNYVCHCKNAEKTMTTIKRKKKTFSSLTLYSLCFVMFHGPLSSQAQFCQWLLSFYLDMIRASIRQIDIDSS